jgi:hypothetical protein
VALVTLLAVVVAGVALARVPRATPAVATAFASVPAETLTATVTDWAQVRAELSRRGGSGLLDRAYDSDASAVSVLGAMVPVMRRHYGWSVLDAEWEALAQSRAGASVVVQLPTGFDLGVVRDGLEELGYQQPLDAGGVWRGGTDLVAGIAPGTTPLMAHAVVLDDTRRVVFSDAPGYAGETAAVVTGDAASFGESEAVRALGEQLEGSVASVAHVGAHGCRVMGFGEASGLDRTAAARRIEAVGGLTRHTGVGMGLVAEPDDVGLRRPMLVVAVHLPRTVADEAQRRARLARGAAPGQGGTYGSRFAVAAAQQRGQDVVLRLRPRHAQAQLLSDLNAGRLLFAACR